MKEAKDATEALGKGHKPSKGKGGKGKVKHVRFHRADSGHIIATHEMHPGEDGTMPEGHMGEHVIEPAEPEAIGNHVLQNLGGGEGQQPE